MLNTIMHMIYQDIILRGDLYKWRLLTITSDMYGFQKKSHDFQYPTLRKSPFVCEQKKTKI